MKWFQHQTDASDDIKIKRLEKKFSLQGYAIFFKIIEKVGKEGENFKLSTKKFPIDDLALDFGAEKKLIDDCLTFMNEIGLIVLKKEVISIPNMKKYASNWTKRTSVGTTEQRQRNYVAPTTKEEIRRDKKRKEESKYFFFDKNNALPPNVKCSYLGNEMRFVAAKRKWFVIDKGQWLEWAGTNEDEAKILVELK